MAGEAKRELGTAARKAADRRQDAMSGLDARVEAGPDGRGQAAGCHVAAGMAAPRRRRQEAASVAFGPGEVGNPAIGGGSLTMADDRGGTARREAEAGQLAGF